ncbi:MULTISPECIES: hypothetical protein [Sphingomonas]|uniref:DUF4435 domain-containing protein n=1 Tax=Sphingomonas molluscorum TaxID=418184 RepID=A0ABU8Q912_9SPHN|nr:hypothetical protein [Sphingomonas sp. JUb134]MBM7407584.1 hypothetical protein [Sphingomonas sp. JUb134]
MTDYVEDLLAEQSNTNGLLLEILTSGYEEWDYLIAIEGVADRAFYYDFLKSALGGPEIRLLDCGGKPCLLKFKKAVEEYSWVNPPLFRYLCDKDFDDYLGFVHPGVWKTEWYSIESYLVNPDFVEYNVAKFSTGQLTPGHRRAFVDRYWQLFRSMAKDIRPYCAFMCEIRSNGEHPQFDDVGIDKLFDLTNRESPRRTGVLETAVKTLKITKPISRVDLLKRARSFKPEEMLRWLRGKLALQIARKCYERAVRATPLAQRTAIPPPTFLGGDALESAYLFWRSLPGLKDYCEG